MNKVKCLFGFHKKKLITRQQTNEIDSVSGINLRRDVYHCSRCHRNIYKRTDVLIGINDKNWTFNRI